MRLNLLFSQVTHTLRPGGIAAFCLFLVVFSGTVQVSHADPAKRLSFFDIEADLTGTAASAVAWGDYDSDGDLDILLTGFSDEGRISRVYRSNGGFYEDISADLLGVMYSSVAWGDYDSDGDLDILLTGYSGSDFYSIVYRNYSGTFVDILAGLAPVGYSCVAWGDYDNDGDLDILLTGYNGSEYLSLVYRNAGGAFVDIGAGLPGVGYSTAAWGDYDNDGDLDILLAGDSDNGYLAMVFENDSGRFRETAVELTGVKYCSGAWGDYDNDGDLDILLTGETGSVNKSKVYRNDAGSFRDIGADLPGIDKSSVAWGDYDNDGDLDILMAGNAATLGRIAKIYRNDAGIFVDANENFPGVDDAAVAWGDFENDGKLDVLLTGYHEYGDYMARVYRNGLSASNSPPTAPTNLTSQVAGYELTFHWDQATDDHTPADGLTYNLRVGSTPGGSDIYNAMASPAGYREIVALGNTQHNTTWTVNLSPPVAPVYYWSVQALDSAFRGSSFAPERVHNPLSPAQGIQDPLAISLLNNVPNPFNPRTTIFFELPSPDYVNLCVYDVSGRLVSTLLRGEWCEQGRHGEVWQGLDDTGRPVPAGIYLYSLEAGGFSETKRMMLVK